MWLWTGCGDGRPRHSPGWFVTRRSQTATAARRRTATKPQPPPSGRLHGNKLLDGNGTGLDLDHPDVGIKFLFPFQTGIEHGRIVAGGEKAEETVVWLG